MPAAKKRDVEGKEKWPHRGGCDHLRYKSKVCYLITAPLPDCLRFMGTW